ncbi:glycosyltransferase family 1 protein [Clostridium sp. AF19-22AC]|jgi:glycosyltransferase involved in cell wall biosynthesis|uniref:glycosyltransferase family 1 protein n=1 Tax=Clostridia TaxID=186801 RepID=UPI000E4E1EA5|nr:MULTISPECIES: glycosyltransferase family 1 protein [Clostridia]RHR28691.1 glycosyltransferase family 1 protein [Clostridium sp. AF19-22AC]
MIRILVVETTEFGYDGISNVVSNYYTYMDQNRLHMDIVTINPIFGQLKNSLDVNGGKNYVLAYRNRNPIKYVNSLISILNKVKYDILHVHGCSATMAVEMIAAYFSGVTVRIAHSHNTKCDHVTADKILRPAFNAFYTHGFACGQEAGEWLFGDKKFHIILNGIDVDKFRFNEKVRSLMQKNNALEEKLIIGHVGRFSEQKNHRKLIDIFTEIAKIRRNAKLVLIGDGELRTEIEAIATKRQLDVLFVGLSDEVEKWLQAFDVVVFPSLFEGLPLGLVEAQAACLPCLLSDTISPMTRITDLVEFESLDSSDGKWAQKVLQMVECSDRCGKSKAIEQQIKDNRFDIRENCNELVCLYMDLLKG